MTKVFSCLALLGLSAGTALAAPPDAFFERQVRPTLLVCQDCHGAKAASAGLRLDRPISPLQAAEVLKRVRGEGNKDRMPLNGTPLNKEQLLSLDQWVKSGATFPPITGGQGAETKEPEKAKIKHWAFQPVVRPSIPVAKNPVLREEWIKNPIDNFVLNKLEANKLFPAPPAGKRALLRRLTYDLLGLPPTPEEVETFFLDKSPDAYEKAIDRLLASPHYGEKWGRSWLDLVRYAETNSYERDNPKPNAFRFRDYVIRSFNSDKPYDRFIKEQLAGDELPDGGNDGLLATGFYRLGIWDDEPTDREQARYDGFDDIVTTVGQTFLGLTVDCARCHDHKIDPIPQKDYYKLVSFFQGINHFRNGGPTDEKPIFTTQEQRESYLSRVSELEKRREENQKKINEIDSEFRSKFLLTSGAGSDLIELKYRYYRDTFLKLPDFDSLKPEREGEITKPYFDITVRDRNQAFGLVFTGVLLVPKEGEYTFYLDSDDGSRLILDDKPILEYDGIHGQGQEKSVKITLTAGRHPVRLEYFQNIFGLGLSVAWEGPQLNRRTLSTLESSGPEALDLTKRIEQKGAEVLGAERVAERTALLKQREALAREEVAVERALIVTEGGPTCPETFVLARGSAAAPGEKVEPGFLECLGGETPPTIPPGITSTGRRLALASWIASPKNRMTARVMVNRIWQGHFGRGLVKTPSDYGLQGMAPTHPALLDWLATEFVKSGWSIKKLHRLILTSATYRMSSQPDPKALAKDPQNDLLWRFDMRRLTAEEIRDSILAASGNLNPATYGPSVYPDIPDSVQQGQSIPGKDWYTGRMSAADKCRRSIYIFQKRSLRFPLLDAFDQAESDRTTATRFASTVPTQALGMLNSDWMQQQAHTLAARVTKEKPDAPARVRRALHLVMQHPPTEAEVNRGIKLLGLLKTSGSSEQATLERFCLLALNLNEFFYLD